MDSEHHLPTDSGGRTTTNNANNNVGNIASFLSTFKNMPAQKQQQLVTSSAALVRNAAGNSTVVAAVNGNNGEPAGSRNHQHLEEDSREKAFEIVYAVTATTNRERDIKPIIPIAPAEKQRNTTGSMCFVVDAHARRIRIVSKEELQSQPIPNHSSSSSPFIRRLRISFVGEPSKLSYRHNGSDSLFPEERTETSDRFVHCDACKKYYDFCCLEHPLYQCKDRDPALSAPNSPSKEGEDRAALTLPGFLYIHNSHIPNAGKGVFTKVDIPIGIVFGPYEGVIVDDIKKASPDGYSWELRTHENDVKKSYYIDAKDPRYSNWMRYINSPRHEGEQNLLAFQYRGSVFYRVYRPIDKNSELLVWYGKSFGKELGIINILPSFKQQKPPPKQFVFYPGKNPFVL